MLVRTGLLRKKTDWNVEQFRNHWLGHHASLARQLKTLRGYVQNLVVAPLKPTSGLPRGSLEFDGFSQLWFDSGAAMAAAISDEIGPKLVADERYFMRQVDIAIARQVEVVRPQKPDKDAKVWSLITRRSGVSAERFAGEWQDVLAPQIAAIPGVRGYRQNLIVEREVPKGTPVGYDQMPIDAISELWFDNVEAIVAAATSVEGNRAASTSRALIGSETPYLVSVHVVV
jgi:uncharacterized protein (TIGR02118 family)